MQQVLNSDDNPLGIICLWWCSLKCSFFAVIDTINRKSRRSKNVALKCSEPVYLNSSQHITALASFPGSGNTWLRYLVQQTSGNPNQIIGLIWLFSQPLMILSSASGNIRIRWALLFYDTSRVSHWNCWRFRMNTDRLNTCSADWTSGFLDRRRPNLRAPQWGLYWLQSKNYGWLKIQWTAFYACRQPRHVWCTFFQLLVRIFIELDVKMLMRRYFSVSWSTFPTWSRQLWSAPYTSFSSS